MTGGLHRDNRRGLHSNSKDDADTVAVAEAAAAEGMAVFAPSWIVWDPGPFPFTVGIFGMWKEAANCAVAFAQQHAADADGDVVTFEPQSRNHRTGRQRVP